MFIHERNKLPAGIIQKINIKLTQDETRFQHESGRDQPYDSLWQHSLRTAQIAAFLSSKEGFSSTAALLAGLLHDTGKFNDGKYHEDDVPEEIIAAQYAKDLLMGTEYENMLSDVTDAILSLYCKDAYPTKLGDILHDADRLDKLGNLGVAYFFTKNTLRGRFLDQANMIDISRELTYALCAPDTMKTTAGKKLSVKRKDRMFRFYIDLFDEMAELGLGTFYPTHIQICGVPVVVVTPANCSCGKNITLQTGTKKTIKCTAVVASYECSRCGQKSEISFCIPAIASQTKNAVRPTYDCDDAQHPAVGKEQKSDTIDGHQNVGASTPSGGEGKLVAQNTEPTTLV